MDKVTSSDGITIAFDRLGDGPPVIVVGGQLCDRALTRPTAEELAKHFTVFDYDRRGRGDSSDTAPYAVEREIEDVGALVTGAAGGRRRCTAIPPVLLSPSTAAAGLSIARLVQHEPPYNPDGDEDRQRATRKEAQHIETLLAEDHPPALPGPALNAAFPAFSFHVNGDARESAGVCKRRARVKEID